MNYYSPKTLNDLVDITDKYKSDSVIVAGCTDVLIKKDFFNDKKAIISLNEIKEIKKIEDLGDKIRIGAGITFSDVINSDLIKNYLKSLYKAAQVCGSLQIRNRATIAGNIVNASPASDSTPPLMVSNAELILISKNGEQRIAIKDFFEGPGKTKLKTGQVLAYIEAEKDKPETITFYRKIGTRKALSIAKASVAFKAERTNGKINNVKVAYGSVGPTVIISTKATQSLNNKELNIESIKDASNKAFNEVTPIDDIRSTAEYRKLIIKNVLIEELNQFI